MVIALFIFAFAVRFVSLLSAGGLDAVLGYDDGVYYSAATAFNHGLMPYRDFVMVHPPGILVLLSPFTWLGHLNSDSVGFIAARIFFMGIGATSTVLVYLIGRRFSRLTAIIAGLTYAVWVPLVRIERTPYLEGIGSLALLIALYLIPHAKVVRNRIAIAGIALGYAVSTKLWFALPVLVIFAWLLFAKQIKSALVLGASSLVTFLITIAWFWYHAGSRFWDLILVAQLNRGGNHITAESRVSQIFNFLSFSFLQDKKIEGIVGLFCITSIFILFLRFRKKRAQGTLIFILFILQLIVLMRTPVFFNAYPSFIGATFALVVGIALGQTHRIKLGTTLFSGFVLVGLYGSFTQAPGVDLPNKIEQLSFADAKCVTSDSPALLILTNTLTKDLHNNCHLLIDVSGEIYGINNGENPKKLTSTKRRLQSGEYQKEVEGYLDSGSVVILARRGEDGLNPASLFRLDQRRKIVKTESFVILSNVN